MKKQNANTKYIVAAVVAVVVLLGVAAYYGLGEQLQGRFGFMPSGQVQHATDNKFSPIDSGMPGGSPEPLQPIPPVSPMNKLKDVKPYTDSYNRLEDTLVPYVYHMEGESLGNDPYIKFSFNLPSSAEPSSATLTVDGVKLWEGSILSSSAQAFNTMKFIGDGVNSVEFYGLFDYSYLKTKYYAAQQVLSLPTTIEIEICSISDVCRTTIFNDANFRSFNF